MPRRIADSLCRIATGAAIRVETAAPDEPVYAAVDRPVILALSHDAELTHIVPADLVDRCLRVDLPGIAPRQRCRNAVLAAAYRDLRPEILGALCATAAINVCGSMARAGAAAAIHAMVSARRCGSGISHSRNRRAQRLRRSTCDLRKCTATLPQEIRGPPPPSPYVRHIYLMKRGAANASQAPLFAAPEMRE